jgi:hypothetical protein
MFTSEFLWGEDKRSFDYLIAFCELIRDGCTGVTYRC